MGVRVCVCGTRNVLDLAHTDPGQTHTQTYAYKRGKGARLGADL